MVLELSKLIKYIRDKRSVTEISRLLGCSRNTVYAWMNEDTIPTMRHIKQIRKIFKKDIDEYKKKSLK